MSRYRIPIFLNLFTIFTKYNNNAAGNKSIIITPDLPTSLYWEDLWRYKELFLILAWRDVAIRYKQAILGVAWALIRPLMTMVVFTVIFGKLAMLPSQGNAPYAILVFAGLLPWQFFSTAITACADSLIANSNLLCKVYFPRLIVPIAAIMAALVDFLLSFLILFCLMLWFNWPPTWRLIAVPILTLFAILASLGPGLLLASLNVKYRDFRYIVPFLVQIGLYISPVGFSSEVVPAKYQFIYSLNPMVSIIEGFRWAIIGDGVHLDRPALLSSLILVLATFYVGLLSFRNLEKVFADVI